MFWTALLGALLTAPDFPAPQEGDAVLRDLRFADGQTLPEAKLHYRTLGRPSRGPDGKVTNADFQTMLAALTNQNRVVANVLVLGYQASNNMSNARAYRLPRHAR